MSKLALVATIKTVPGKREEYLKHPRLTPKMIWRPNEAPEFEILVPREEADTVMLYEVDEARRPSKRIGTARPSSKPTGTSKASGSARPPCVVISWRRPPQLAALSL